MEVVQMIIDIINNVGFPIAVCIGLMYIIVVMYKSNNEYQKETNNVMKDLTNAVDKMTTIIDIAINRKE